MGAGSSSGSNRRRFNVPSLAGMGGRRLLVVLCLNIGDVSHIQATLRMRLVAAEPYSQSRRPRAMCASNSPPPKNDVQIQAASLLAVAKRIDAGASIAAVTKSYDSTLFKIDPSADAGAALTLATLSALRISFPFATTTAVENVATGSTQLHTYLHTNTEDFRHAQETCRTKRSMRFLKSVSNGFFVIGLCSYAALLYAAAEQHTR